LPGWSSLYVDIDQASQTIESMEADRLRHRYYHNIFGMVKLIDDNVGKLLDHLKEKRVADNTIIVFTSDHGDQLGKKAIARE